MTDEPFLSVTVGATPEEVWQALRDPDRSDRGCGWEYPGLDDEIALIFHGRLAPEIDLPEGVDTAIDVDDEARTLRTGPHQISVSPEGEGGAVVRVTRVIDVGDAGWEAFHAEIDHIEEGWLTFFQTLAFAAARHPGEPRRTVFGMGLLDADDPWEALGLGAVASAGPGDGYALTLATGDELAGTVWFRSDHQLGLTVDGWGDGLLVAAALPRTDAGTPLMAIASTYDLAEETVAEMTTRWGTWWQTNTVTPPPPEP